MSDAIKSYKEGIRARNEERQASKKPVFPDLGQVATAFDPATSGNPVNIAAAAAQLQAGDSPKEKRTELSSETVEGLRAVFAAQQQQPMAEGPVEEHKGEAPSPGVESEIPEEFAVMFQQMRAEADANKREKEAVAKRVQPMDIGEGILSGEYTQEVPVVVGKLTVRYRSLTSIENLQLRELVHQYVKDHPTLENMYNDILGLYQTVASLVSINSTVFPKHLAATHGHLPQFSVEIFNSKMAKFMLFPGQLLSTISVHSVWFAERVADLFRNPDDLKNG